MVEGNPHLHLPLFPRPDRTEAIRILYVIGPMLGGGAERHLIELIQNLDRKRFEPHAVVLTRPGRLFSELQAVCVSCRCLRRRHRYDPRVLVRLGMLLRRLRPRIIHSYMWTGNLWGRLAALLFHRSALRIAAERCPDSWKSPWLLAIDRLLYRYTHCLVAVADAVADFYRRETGMPEERIRVIRNGKVLPSPPMDRHQAREHFRLPENALVYTLSGRFSPEKGQRRLLDIFPDLLRQVPQALLFLPGEGPLRDEIRARAEQLGVADRVLLPGFVEDREQLYAISDVVVVPSDYEGISNVLLEAMARTLPVVATRVGGNPEVIVDGQSGLLVPAGDPGRLLSALAALGRSPALRRRLGFGAARRFHQEFTLDRMIRAHQELYLELLEMHGGRR